MYFFAQAKKSTGIASINQQVPGSFPQMTPPLQEQRRKAEQLRISLKATKELLVSARGQLAEIERLPARLLAQAFGEVAARTGVAPVLAPAHPWRDRFATR